MLQQRLDECIAKQIEYEKEHGYVPLPEGAGYSCNKAKKGRTPEEWGWKGVGSI